MPTIKPPFTLEDSDLDFIAEMLRVASASLAELLAHMHRKCPEAALNDSLRAWLTRNDALLARLEQR